jgi:hypothetical protein
MDNRSRSASRSRWSEGKRGLTRPRKGVLALTVLSMSAVLSAVGITPANAVHDTGAFELDGNAVNDAVAGEDWDNVCRQVTITNDTAAVIPNQCASASNSTATAVSWTDDGSLNASIFTGGGSKDPQDISSWAWKDGAGGLPDKDNLLHSFAARYSLAKNATTCPAPTASPTCEVLYFGSDRYDNSGDAQEGFWFLQNEIELGSNAVGGGSGFSGVHREGDVLVISNFSNGGSTSTITVYQWDTTCTRTSGSCGDANLRILETSDSARCSALLPSGDPFCGIVNPSNGTSAPWSFTDKSGNSSYLNGEFYEGGINLSALGLDDECFSTVVSETRSSTSTTAVLKDFVLGDFGSCGSTLVTTPKDGSGAAIPSTGLPMGATSVTATDSAVLTVTGINTWSGTLSFFLCGPIATGTCTTGGTQIGTAMAVTQATSQPILSAAATITQTGRYCWRGFFDSGTTGVPDATDSSAGECFTVVALQTTISTHQFVFPQDKATVVLPGGGTLAGSITFELYDTLANCQANTATGLLYSEGPLTVSGASPQSKTTSNTTYRVSDSTSAALVWRVAYASTNAGQLGSSSACVESTSVTYAGNDAGITFP